MPTFHGKATLPLARISYSEYTPMHRAHCLVFVAFRKGWWSGGVVVVGC